MFPPISLSSAPQKCCRKKSEQLTPCSKQLESMCLFPLPDCPSYCASAKSYLSSKRFSLYAFFPPPRCKLLEGKESIVITDFKILSFQDRTIMIILFSFPSFHAYNRSPQSSRSRNQLIPPAHTLALNLIYCPDFCLILMSNSITSFLKTSTQTLGLRLRS